MISDETNIDSQTDTFIFVAFHILEAHLRDVIPLTFLFLKMTCSFEKFLHQIYQQQNDENVPKMFMQLTKEKSHKPPLNH